MSVNDKLEKIKNIILNDGFCTVNELIKQVEYSPSSIRRYLSILEKKGVIERWHGGAASPEYSRLSYVSRMNINKEKKEEIGKKAASLVKDGDVVILDAGSTASMVLNNIIDKKGLTVITTAVNIAKKLSTMSNFEVILIGGVFNLETNSMLGHLARLALEYINANIAFVACDSISSELDIMLANFELAELKKAIIKSATVKVLIADSSKFGKISIASIGKIDIFDKVVIDCGLSQEYREKIKKYGIELII
ncbi:DeoR/GlpR transcriptional regulator [candidate division WOR-3 bacterium]|nr:DeoR/GlpR transcriptional regulator [candidate division WOR-3 bacterium]